MTKYHCKNCDRPLVQNGDKWKHADGITYRHPTEPKPVYNFQEQLKIGQEGEAFLDSFFRGKGVQVEVVDDLDTQRRGIDRYFHIEGKTFSVEYKTDHTAARTGNAFLEMAVDKKAGWVQRTEADFIAYYVPGRQVIYLVRPERIRELLGAYINKLQWGEIRNDSFVAYGMLLPLDRKPRTKFCLEGIASKTYYIYYDEERGEL